MPLFTVVVAAPPAVRGPEDLAGLPAYADLVELRLDLLPDIEGDDALARWIAASPRAVIATVRSRAEGGAFDGAPEAAARRLEAAARAGAAWIDVEAPVAPHVRDLPRHVEVLASYHGDGVPRGPRTVAGRAVRHRKVARPIAGAEALERARREARAAVATGDRTVVPYGPLGGLRAAFVHSRSFLFGSATDDASVVAGQPLLRALLDESRVDEVGPDARLFGLLGRPPARSPSPALHNAAFRALGLDALYLPLPGLRLETALDLPFQGFSVTTPYKERALALAAHADGTTLEIGAANTLVRREDGSWRASNTDAEAIMAAVGPAPAGATAFVYGAGGFARAAGFALAARGHAVRLGARNDERGRRVARAAGWESAGTYYVRRPTDRVLVNATPAGADGRMPGFLERASLCGLVVLDAPYRRDGATALEALAARDEAELFIGGLRLLAGQAAGQVRSFTGCEVEGRVLDTALDPPLPLLLLGLRGAGKSAVGRSVARRLGRPFLDLDEEVERITGLSPARWIRERGEPAFREAEAAAVARLAGRRGVVVAAGGGVLEHARARAVVVRHTIPIWLDVPPEVAARRAAADGHDRPPLTTATDPEEESRRLHDRRKDAWGAVARYVVDASPEVDAVAEQVARRWLSEP